MKEIQHKDGLSISIYLVHLAVYVPTCYPPLFLNFKIRFVLYNFILFHFLKTGGSWLANVLVLVYVHSSNIREKEEEI